MTYVDRLLIVAVLALGLWFWYSKECSDNCCPDGVCPVKPAPLPVPKPDPIPKTPSPAPMPPANKATKVLFFTSDNCHWCDKLKSELPDPLPLPIEYHKGPAMRSFYEVDSVPTLIAVDKSGKALKRQVGYLSKAELISWFAQ